MRLSATLSFVPVLSALVWGQDLPNVNPAPATAPIPTPPPNAAVVAGKFVLEDGSQPPAPVRVELTCNSIGRPMGWSNAKGDFSVQLAVDNPDEVSDLTYAKAIERSPSGVIGMGAPPSIDKIPRDFAGCDLRGVLPGYRSDIVALSGRRGLDSPELGSIALRRLGKVDGLTTSATTAMAPPAARKEHEKAIAALKKRKPDVTPSARSGRKRSKLLRGMRWRGSIWDACMNRAVV